VIVYAVIIVVGVCGNSVVVNVVVRHRHLHTSINGFIACLVISDIVLCTFSLPIQLHYQLTNHWVDLHSVSFVMRKSQWLQDVGKTDSVLYEKIL